VALVPKREASKLAKFEPTLSDVQAAGFPMGGEGLAVDLADTIVTVTDPHTDLLIDQAASDGFWTIHAIQLPLMWEPPTLEKTRTLRNAIREIFDATQQGLPIAEKPLEFINSSARLALPATRATLSNGLLERHEEWQFQDPADLALAAAARSALHVLIGPDSLVLRRCQSANCSMLFVTGDARRRWCTPNICANRDRVARHHRRHHPPRP
jgi:predicted RNA-binding Zn ribbon-like protein